MTGSSVGGSGSRSSLDILRDQGPMRLDELTAATASAMGVPQMYAWVDAVMRGHFAKGLAACDEDPLNFRASVWSAT